MRFNLLELKKVYSGLQLSKTNQVFKYKVITFGLKDALYYFQQYIDAILGNFLHKSTLAYFKNILTFSKTSKENYSKVQ